MKQQSKNTRNRVKREQPRKDSKSKRINMDNERVSKFDKDMRDCNDGTNDVRWYAQNPELLRAAASVSFYNTLGANTPFVGSDGSTNAGKSIPGILTLQWSPFVGGAENEPLRQASNQIYSFTVHANSRNYEYDPADSMLLILAGSQVFATIALGIRAYGVLQNFSGQDYYTPQALVSAMGFNYADLRNNQSQMWFDLNHLIAKSRQIWIPNVMPLTERWFWLNSNIYKDGKSAKAQYYVFVPQNFLQYDATTESTGGSLQSVPWKAEGSHTWAQYLTKINAMMDALLNSQDRGIIFGDFLKAYGADRIYTLSEIQADYRVTPVYNPEVLTQIENATIIGQYPGKVVQTQNDHQLKQDFNSYTAAVINQNYYRLSRTGVLNFHQLENPTPEQIMVASRLMVLGSIAKYVTEVSGNYTYAATPMTAGTEVIYSASMYSWKWDTGVNTLAMTEITPKWIGGGLDSVSVFEYVSFDWAPILYWVAMPGISGTITERQDVSVNPRRFIADYDNYTFISVTELQKMHTAAIYSEFGVPQI